VFRPSCKPATNPRLVVVGGPGQGKSTLGQLLCQVYRVALLADRPEESMGPDAAQVLRSTRSQLARLGVPMPAARRWPLQVSLSAYGDTIAGHPDVSLLRFLAEQVSRRTPERVTASDLVSWLQAWPWLLVLDGLDEVAAPTVRETLLQQVSDFLTDAAAADADLMVVATTRPQGYAWEFSPAYYDHLKLRQLERREALGYARRLAAVRHAGDPDLEAQVVARVANAAEDPITARLLRSPLQVTIMSILLERRVRVPQDRHGLFDAYYQTIYDREAAKPGPVGLLLDQQRSNVNLLHEQVGLLLQIRAERGGDAEALLPRQDLQDLAHQRLREEGHADINAERLAAQLVAAATKRLVLLVPLTADAVGFEVRSLQEFMAARALLRGDSTLVLERLRRLAPSAHWRNTWLLAAGRAFTHHEHLRDPIVTLLEEVDTDSLLAMLVAPGAQLAMDVLDDDIAAQAPRYRLLFAKRALELLDHPPEAATSRLGHTLRRVCEAHPPTRLMVDNAIDRALASKGPLSVAALMVLAQWEEGTGGLAASDSTSSFMPSININVGCWRPSPSCTHIVPCRRWRRSTHSPSRGQAVLPTGYAGMCTVPTWPRTANGSSNCSSSGSGVSGSGGKQRTPRSMTSSTTTTRRLTRATRWPIRRCRTSSSPPPGSSCCGTGRPPACSAGSCPTGSLAVPPEGTCRRVLNRTMAGRS
jgi:hypothetical protein